MALTAAEEQKVRDIIAQEALKESATLHAIDGLKDELKSLKDLLVTELGSLKDRVSRLERFQWATIGGIVMIVTGLPAAAFLVKLVGS